MHWLTNGAQPTDPVKVLLQKTGVWERFTGEAPPPADQPAAAEASKETAEEPSGEAVEDEDESTPATEGREG